MCRHSLYLQFNSLQTFLCLLLLLQMLSQMLQRLWTCNGLHPIFIYISIKVQMFITLQKPCVIFPLNFLALLPQLSLLWKCHMWYLLLLHLRLSFLWRCHLWYLLLLLPQLSLMWRCHLWYFLFLLPQLFVMWRCHLWYFYRLFNYLYNYWHYRWFHSALHHFFYPCICALLFPLHS